MDVTKAASLQIKLDQLFPQKVTADPKEPVGKQTLDPAKKVPHGTHPTTLAIKEYRGNPAADVNVEAATHPVWGVWAPIPCRSVDLPGMPIEYIRCVVSVPRPYDILKGDRKPSSPEETEIVCQAVEAMLVGFIELMLVIQLKYLEIHNDYKLLSKDSIHRHAACAMLRKGPRDTLTQTDMKKFEEMRRRKVAPFEEALRDYDRPSLLQFFERQLGTLYIFGVPVMSTRVMRTEPGWRDANKILETVGSKLRLRLCVLGSSTELLLGEPVLDKCTAEVIVVGAERARTAMLAYEVASTQDTSENPVKMFRTESTAFIVHHKWDISRIELREWNPLTYGPTQKLVIADALRRMGGDKAAVRTLLEEHCRDSLLEYQLGEQMVNGFTFSPVIRGILHALFSRHVPLEDMHSWLVDTICRPTQMGILNAILASRFQDSGKARIRLLMYMTDTWFKNDRLYTLLMMGSMVAAIQPGKTELDYKLLKSVLFDLYGLTAKALAHLAERAQARFRETNYRVLSHMLNFDSISVILTRQYHRNDGHVDESSLRFNSSFWMNILGYFVRLTNGVEALDAEICGLVNAFLTDVIDLLCSRSPALRVATAGVAPKVEDFASLRRRIVVYFEIFSAMWDKYVRMSYASILRSTNCEPPAKMQRLV